jgi:hypothetical protein
MGIKDFPDNPKNLIDLSIKNTALAIYPEFSKTNKNVCITNNTGINLNKVLTPTAIPSLNIVNNQLGMLNKVKIILIG